MNTTIHINTTIVSLGGDAFGEPFTAVVGGRSVDDLFLCQLRWADSSMVIFELKLWSLSSQEALEEFIERLKRVTTPGPVFGDLDVSVRKL